jgi:hypothetical protein
MVTCSTVWQVSSCCKVSKFIIFIILHGIIHGRWWWGHHWRDDVRHAGLQLLHQSRSSLQQNICYEPLSQITYKQARTLTLTCLFTVQVSYTAGYLCYAARNTVNVESWMNTKVSKMPSWIHVTAILSMYKTGSLLRKWQWNLFSVPDPSKELTI